MELKLNEFYLLRDLVHEKSGMFFEEKKLYFLKNRLKKRMTEINCDTPLDYYRIIKFDDKHNELSKFINLLTINETYFFRELPHLKAFAEEALPEVMKEKKANKNRNINILSAACSTGDEPYSIAILVKEKIPNLSSWSIKIWGTDINKEVIESAKQGIYNARAVKYVPPLYLNKYFTKVSDNYLINDTIKKMVDFRILNITDRFTIRQYKNIDFLFCKNVLIYFSDDVRKKVLNSFYNQMNKGGFIFLGHSESVGRISAMFKLVKYKNSLVYKK